MYYCIIRMELKVGSALVAQCCCGCTCAASNVYQQVNKMKMIHFISYFRAKMKYEMVQNKYKNVI